MLRSLLQTGAFSRQFSTSGSMSAIIKNVTVVGGGLMGSGIAQVAAQTEHNVTLVDVSTELLDKTKSRINDSLKRVAKKQFKDDAQAGDKFIRDCMSRLSVNVDVKAAVKNCDLVVEAIVENLEVKQKLFAEIEQVAPASTIFASNTSSLQINKIAEHSSRKDKFGGLHFFNPVPVMKLLEVVKTNEMSEETYQSLMKWGAAIGKTTVTCRDTPGFVVNRLLVPYMMEAMKMLERGDASARDIDVAMKLGAGYPMGPFELSDYVGLDTSLFIISGWEKDYPDNPLFKVPQSLKQLVKDGKLGVKTGEGFYKYDKK